MAQQLKTRATVNAKIAVFVSCVETIIYSLLCNFHDCTFYYAKRVKMSGISKVQRLVHQWYKSRIKNNKGKLRVIRNVSRSGKNFITKTSKNLIFQSC